MSAAKIVQPNMPRHRLIKPHAKSRSGCRNCKLRRVKCAEEKPECSQCKRFGVKCNFVLGVTDLESFDVCQPNPDLGRLEYAESKAMLGILPAPMDPSRPGDLDAWTFGIPDVEILHRFHTRTVTTLGSWRFSPLYKQAYSTFTLPHPFLMHTVLAVTLMHDRALGVEVGAEQANAISYHWSQGARLLNFTITNGCFDASEGDAMWACAGLLSLLSWASFDEKSDPDDAWPLNAASDPDLGWLKMSEGKHAVYELVQPWRKESMLRPAAIDFMQYRYPPYSNSTAHLQRLPQDLLWLCDIDPDSTPESNPYHSSVSTLAHLIDLQPCQDNTLRFVFFFGAMHRDLKNLIIDKDPRGLLLLVFWQSKVCHAGLWWLSKRAAIEGRAVCAYLEKYHWQEDTLMSLLQYPKMALF